MKARQCGKTAASLSNQEKEVYDITTQLWNKFLLLKSNHPDKMDEFRHKLHDLQRIILARPYHNHTK
jgi:hypothetical protein